MEFNEKKYKNCINNLNSLKANFVFIYIIIFSTIGLLIGYTIQYFTNFDWKITVLGACISAIIGLIIGLFSTWEIEMKIQEANWRIDTLNELKKQSSIANKNVPFAKTVVSIENNSQTPNSKIS